MESVNCLQSVIEKALIFSVILHLVPPGSRRVAGRAKFLRLSI